MAKVRSLFINQPFISWAILALISSFVFRMTAINVCVWILAIVLAVHQAHKNKIRKHLEFLRNEAQEYIDTIRKNKSLTVIPSPIFLSKTEHLFLQQDLTKLLETRAVRHSGGGFGSVRVTRGIRIGGYSGQSESSQEWRTLDIGKLMLTNEKSFLQVQKKAGLFPWKRFSQSKYLETRSIFQSMGEQKA